MFCFSKTIDIFQRHHFPAEQIEWAASGNLLFPAISKLFHAISVTEIDNLQFFCGDFNDSRETPS
jgi:hypothetical protein